MESQTKAARARSEGKFTDEIVPITTKMKAVDKEKGGEIIPKVVGPVLSERPAESSHVTNACARGLIR